MNRLFNRASNWTRRSASKPNNANRSLRFEQVEARQMMTVYPYLGDMVAPQNPIVFDGGSTTPGAEGSIGFNAANGTLTIDGWQGHDQIKIYINHRAGNGAGNIPDLLTVSLANIGTPQIRVFDPLAVKKIVVNGNNGNDRIDNLTSVPMTAFGGIGNDVILGGSGDDFFRGGDGEDFLDGRLGNDTIYGEAGHDAIFGDAGGDWLFGGAGYDRIFGGSGDDSLWGEDGNDFLYGGAGTDRLTDNSGTNTNYADYGPNNTLSASGFQAFDWFDRNLQDATVRSMAREEFRDGVLDRMDMLALYTTISTDGIFSIIPNNGTVSSAELGDLKDLISTKINMPNDSRFFATKIANGDRANGWYHSATLGNLVAGSPGSKLTKLADKWFKGGDLPALSDDDGAQYGLVTGSLFYEGISYKDIAQEAAADCYFMVALGQVARRTPSTITRMFGDNGDGTYSVRFYHDGVSEYVTVNQMLPMDTRTTSIFAGWGAEIPASGNGRLKHHSDDYRNELWVALAEKAYVQLNESGWIGQDGKNAYHGIDFGRPEKAFSHLINKSPSVYFVTTTFGDTKSEFLAAVRSGKAVTLCSKGDNTNTFIVHSHCYMVIGYDEVTKKFELANPYGVNSLAAQPATVFVTFAAIRHDFNDWTSVMI